MNSILIDTLNDRDTIRPPVWFMRQAGRILPSYQKLKSNNSFRELMNDPKLASQVTLLPINDLGVDAAILFSDILIIPEALGMKLEFTKNGPKFHDPLNGKHKKNNFNFNTSKLDHVYKNIKEVVKNRPNNLPLIGFCGGPLTTFLFMFRGNENEKNFKSAIKFFYTNTEESLKIIELITEASIEYAKQQVISGIDCFQLFETYCGIIPQEMYKNLILPQSKKILNAVKKLNTPTIFFPKNFSGGLKYINKDICDFVSIDWQISLKDARMLVDKNVGLQGNMDPRILYSSYNQIDNYLNSLIDFGSKNQKWIFNLGHGFIPDIDYKKAKYVVNWIKEANWKR